MRSLTLLAALVTVLLGAEGNGSAAAEDPPVCCLPGQWQATKVHSYVSVRNRRFRFGKVVSHVAHDNIKGREVFFTTRSDNLVPETTLVYYLSNEERIMYVYNNATGKCIKQEMRKPFSECCVPASAVMEDEELVYGEGSSNVTAFRASFSVPRSRGPDLSISVTATDKCVPIVE